MHLPTSLPPAASGLARFTDVFPLLSTGKPSVKWSKPWQGVIAEGQPYGIPTGPRNGVWVLDLDRKNGKDGVRSLSEWAGVRELPDTLTVRTKSGGVHLYFAWDPSRLVKNRAGVLEGIDVRGEKGFVRAGPGYEVISSFDPAQAPDWLYDLILPAAQKSAEAPTPSIAISPEDPRWIERLRLAHQFLLETAPCISGQGGQARLWAVSLRLTRTYELAPEVSWQLIESTGYNARCVPPWTKEEAIRTLERAAQQGIGPTGTFSVTSPLFAAVPATPITVSADGPWRQKRDPKHVYSFDMATAVAGGSNKLLPQTQKEIASVFTGPGASPVWRGVWQYDLFRRRIVAVNPPLKLDAETVGLSDIDLFLVQLWCVVQGLRVSLESIRSAISVAAKSAEFHPIIDYLDSLEPTDQKSAADYFSGIAARLWGAPKDRNDIESAQLKRMAIAAVRRVRKPGTKVDTMFVLQGKQGYYKSQFCARLFGEYFRDQMPDLSSRDASIAIEGYWGIEFAEFASFRRSEENTKKEFLSRSIDKYRPMWAPGTLEVPRQCVFLGTTNEDDFLHDPTGNRRYDICEIVNPIDVTFDRDRFWSAACALESAGVPHWIESADDQKSAEVSAARFHADDTWTKVILEWIHRQTTPYILASDALTYGVPVPVDRQTREHLTRVKSILRRRLGPSRVTHVRGTGAAVRAYINPSPAKAAPEPAPGPTSVPSSASNIASSSTP